MPSPHPCALSVSEDEEEESPLISYVLATSGWKRFPIRIDSPYRRDYAESPVEEEEEEEEEEESPSPRRVILGRIDRGSANQIWQELSA